VTAARLIYRDAIVSAHANEPNPRVDTDRRRPRWHALPPLRTGRLFKNLIRMNPECDHCHLHYEREPGYFLGSIYINYGLTALLVTLFYFALFFSEVVSPQTALWIVTAFAFVFPIWFFRYARSLWMGFDHYWDPTTDGPGSGQRAPTD
jgi:uncharacterized protein (DUF983 family)